MVPPKGKGVVQTRLVVSLPLGVYARIAPCSGLAVKKFIDVGAGVIDSDYRGEIGVVLFNHSAMNFSVQVGDRIAQLILEKIKIPTVQKVIVLSVTDRGSGGFGSTGLQSSGSSSSLIQKENRAEKSEKVQKERMLEGSKKKWTRVYLAMPPVVFE